MSSILSDVLRVAGIKPAGSIADENPAAKFTEQYFVSAGV